MQYHRGGQNAIAAMLPKGRVMRLIGMPVGEPHHRRISCYLAEFLGAAAGATRAAGSSAATGGTARSAPGSPLPVPVPDPVPDAPVPVAPEFRARRTGTVVPVPLLPDVPVPDVPVPDVPAPAWPDAPARAGAALAIFRAGPE